MNRYYIALGSNLGNREQNIANAISAIKALSPSIKTSFLYETSPVGFQEQNLFINTVTSIHSGESPVQLLNILKNLEEQLGRVKRFINGPREIDLDILLGFDSNNNLIEVKTEHLSLPHPRFSERLFVLKPLSDILTVEDKESIVQYLNENPFNKNLKNQQIRRFDSLST